MNENRTGEKTSPIQTKLATKVRGEDLKVAPLMANYKISIEHVYQFFPLIVIEIVINIIVNND